ncbi:MAG: TIGR00296 family protein [Candidatus Caldarchaeum sp.]|nr:TIGR00296 family protein [Candidatus Caldarchaeum sp.]MDW8360394.1 TIGR00296 family protein [Candidatus Caldarchaeum sp.]
MDDKTGATLVSIARRAVESYLRRGEIHRSDASGFLAERRGVFVSIYSYPDRDLRGCVGFVRVDLPLAEATARAAVAAAFEDPRFPPLGHEELSKVVFEVSLLTPPEPIDVSLREKLPEHVVVGEDGLIIETPYGSGLLLPQVPVEYGWNAEEYLSHLCLKAGLDPTYWVYGKMRLSRFKAEVFMELEPRGPVERKKI